MSRKLTSVFRSERGEVGIIPVIAGSAMFMIAVIGVVSTITLSLGASAMAQNNTELTAALRAHVQEWEGTAWSDVVPGQKLAEEINLGDKTVTVSQDVSYTPELNSYTMTVAAARATMPGATPPDCTAALTQKVNGCIAVSGTIAASPNDIRPDTPPGIELSTELVGSDGHGLNLIADSGFETGELTGWAVSPAGGATISDIPARALGTKSLIVSGGASVASPYSSTGPGYEYQIAGWTKATSGSGKLTIGYSAATQGGQFTSGTLTTVLAADAGGWTPFIATFTAPPTATSVGLTASVGAGAEACDSDCNWALDDVSLTLTHQNLAPTPDFEATTPSWVLAGGAAVGSNPNRAAPGTNTLGLTTATASATSANVSVTPGAMYTFGVWVRNPGPAGQPGTMQLNVVAGTTTTVAAMNLAGMTSEWTQLQGAFTAANGVTTARLLLQTQGAPATASIQVDDAILYKTANPPGDTDRRYLTLAQIDPTALGVAADGDKIAVRVSFKYVGAGPEPTDLTAAIFCNSASYTSAIVTNSMTTLVNEDANETWYWARVDLPDLSRLIDCSAPTLRVYSESGTPVETTDVGTVSVFRVLPGVKMGGSQP